VSEVNAAAIAAAAELAGIAIPAEDIDLLVRTMRRYADVAAPLRAAQLDGIEPAATSDPRVSW
jgi:hypothetical protein